MLYDIDPRVGGGTPPATSNPFEVPTWDHIMYL